MTKIITAARACVIHNGKLLLVRGKGVGWHLPGGHMEPRENLVNCAQREVYEETGYQVIVQDLIYVYEFYDTKWNNHKVECVFRAEVKNQPQEGVWQDLGHDKSITMIEWFSLEEIQARQDIQPMFLKDGKWTQIPQGPSIYHGYKGE